MISPDSIHIFLYFLTLRKLSNHLSLHAKPCKLILGVNQNHYTTYIPEICRDFLHSQHPGNVWNWIHAPRQQTQKVKWKPKPPKKKIWLVCQVSFFWSQWLFGKPMFSTIILTTICLEITVFFFCFGSQVQSFALEGWEFFSFPLHRYLSIFLVSFPKRGNIFIPQTHQQKMIKKPSDLDSISSFWVTRAATSSWWANGHNICVWYIHKRFVSKKQLPFLGGEVRYQKIDGKKIYFTKPGGLSYYPIPLGLVFLTWRHKIRSHKISPVWKPECFLPRPSWV